MAVLGSDFAGVFDLDAALSTIEGRPALAQAILRRLTTERGGLIGNAKYGYNLRSLIGSSVPRSVVEQRVHEQVMDEEEVENATVEVSYDAASSKLTVLIDVEDGEGPFNLTVNVTELTLEALLDGAVFLQAA